MTAPLMAVLRVLYEREINVAITSFWDCGIVARIGDPLNGFQAERPFTPHELDEVAGWLWSEAVRLYPQAFEKEKA